MSRFTRTRRLIVTLIALSLMIPWAAGGAGLFDLTPGQWVEVVLGWIGFGLWVAGLAAGRQSLQLWGVRTLAFTTLTAIYNTAILFAVYEQFRGDITSEIAIVLLGAAAAVYLLYEGALVAGPEWRGSA